MRAMLQGSKIAVIVPAFDEEAHITGVLDGIPAYVDDIIVVDDASTDATADRVYAHRDPRVRLLRHRVNRGVGATIASGYRAAFVADADAVAVMAGDGQMDPQDLERLLEPVVQGQADYVKGDRLSHPQARTSMPVTRWLGNHMLSLLTRWATGLRIRDSQCGYTVLGRAAAQDMPLERIWAGYGYPNDLLGRLACSEMRVSEVAVRPIYGQERSGIRLRHAFAVIPFVLLRVLCRRARSAWREEPMRDPAIQAPGR